MTDHAALDLLSDVLIHHGACLCSRCREAGCCVADRLISRAARGRKCPTRCARTMAPLAPNAMTNN
jgi:hypothetical protein